MSPEERQLLTSLFDRIETASAAPRDRDADAFIAQAVDASPHAPYFLAQAVILQEQGLKAAAERIDQLQAHVRDLEQAADSPPAPTTSFLGGIGSILVGPQPQPMRSSVPQTGRLPQAGQPGRLYDDHVAGGAVQPQQPSPGPWSQQAAASPSGSAGGGFLRGALGTAAGVAGGMMLAESLRGLFGAHVGGLAGGLPGGFGAAGLGTQTPVVEETVINNYGSDADRRSNDAPAPLAVDTAGNDDRPVDDPSGYDDPSDTDDTGSIDV